MGNDLLGVRSCKCLRGPAAPRSLKTTGRSIRGLHRARLKPRGPVVMTVAHGFITFHKKHGAVDCLIHPKFKSNAE